MSEARVSMAYRALMMGAHSRVQVVAIMVGALLLSSWLIGSQVLYAAWGMIDDHDTLTFIGAGNDRLPISEYFHVMFTKTELGSLGHYLRFRPFYYPAMLGEAVIWGNNVHLWYAARVVLFAVFIAGIWIAIARHVGVLLGLAVVMVIVRAPYWGDVLARLGPGEIYGAAGLGIWILGLEYMFTSSNRHMRTCALAFVSCGTIMMVGSKETMFPFAGYAILAFALFIYVHRTSLAGWINLTVLVVYSVGSAAVIAMALSRAGEDFLGRSVSMTERLQQLVQPLNDSALKFMLPAMLLLVVTAILLVMSSPQRARILRQIWLKPAVIYSAGVVLLWSLYLSQFVGYNGQWPTGIRYDFPGMLATPLLVAISVIFIAAIIKPFPRSQAFCEMGVAAGAVVVILYLLTRAPFPLANDATANINKTVKFQTTLSELAGLARADLQKPIILRANGAWTYEKIVSIAVYLRLYYRLSNDIAVKFYPDGNADPKFIGLGKSIKAWEVDGRPQQLMPLASVIERARTGCLSIGLDGPGEPGCSGDFRL